MSAVLPITLAPNVHVQLLAARALFWPDEATLFVADLHLGKPEVFHQRGIPVPGAVSGDDLARLAAALVAVQAKRLVILGDLFHARVSQSESVVASLRAWRAAHPALDVRLVTGNHDRHAGPPPQELGIVACGAEVRIGPFRCLHEPPAPTPGGELTLCGHVHPVALLQDGRSSLRLPCFHLAQGVMTLPAFGAFTGGGTIRARAGDGVWVIADGRLFQVHSSP